MRRPKKRKVTTLRCTLAMPSRKQMRTAMMIMPIEARTIAIFSVMSDWRKVTTGFSISPLDIEEYLLLIIIHTYLLTINPI
jgi:hypothetical protein